MCVDKFGALFKACRPIQLNIPIDAPSNSNPPIGPIPHKGDTLINIVLYSSLIFRLRVENGKLYPYKLCYAVLLQNGVINPDSYSLVKWI